MSILGMFDSNTQSHTARTQFYTNHTIEVMAGANRLTKLNVGGHAQRSAGYTEE